MRNPNIDMSTNQFVLFIIRNVFKTVEQFMILNFRLVTVI